MSERRRDANGQWWTMAWYGAEPDHGGPFLTEEEAIAWIEKTKKKQERQNRRAK